MLRYKSEKYGLVDLSQIVFVRREFLSKGLKHIIIFQGDKGYSTWQYDTMEDRDKEFDAIEKLWK